MNAYNKFLLLRLASMLALLSAASLVLSEDPAKLLAGALSLEPLTSDNLNVYHQTLLALTVLASVLLAAAKRPWALALLFLSASLRYVPVNLPSLVYSLLPPLTLAVLIATTYSRRRVAPVTALAGGLIFGWWLAPGVILTEPTLLLVAVSELLSAVQAPRLKVASLDVSCNSNEVKVTLSLKGDTDIFVPDYVSISAGLNRPPIILYRSNAAVAEYRGSGFLERGGKANVVGISGKRRVKLGKLSLPDPISVRVNPGRGEVRVEIYRGGKPFDPDSLRAEVDGKAASPKKVSEGVYSLPAGGNHYIVIVESGKCSSRAEWGSPAVQPQQPPFQVQQPPVVTPTTPQQSPTPVSQTAQPPSPQSDPFVGKTLYGYTIIRKLGEGGFSLVYEAEKGGRKYAVKIPKLNTILGTGSSKIPEILEEARGLSDASKSSPFVVSLEGVFVDRPDFAMIASGKVQVYYERPPMIVMELMAGGNLYDLMMDDNLFYAEEWPQVVMLIVSRVARALADVHKSGYVHSDVKPQNIMLSDRVPLTGKGFLEALTTGRVQVKLGDLGNAVKAGGSPLGFTPQYSSLEQVISICKSSPSEGISPVDDVYALGATMFTLLTRTSLNSQEMVDAVNSVDDCRQMDYIRKERLKLYATRDFRPLLDALKSSNLFSSRAQEIVNFVMRMTAPERSQRPTALEVASFFERLTLT
ncbi:MAG: protein kinase domain-containing protein [Thermoprotei archaeon]